MPVVPGFKLRGLRWWIIGLVFLATLINYIDRLTISVLAPAITKDLNLDRFQYGTIATWFLLAYTISQALSGKLYDRVGTRRVLTRIVCWWSAFTVLTGFAFSFPDYSNVKIFVEARYHHIFTGGLNPSLIPVTVGVRF